MIPALMLPCMSQHPKFKKCQKYSERAAREIEIQVFPAGHARFTQFGTSIPFYAVLNEV